MTQAVEMRPRSQVSLPMSEDSLTSSDHETASPSASARGGWLLCLTWALCLIAGLLWWPALRWLSGDRRHPEQRLLDVSRLAARGEQAAAEQAGLSLLRDHSLEQSVRDRAALLLGQIAESGSAQHSAVAYYGLITPESRFAQEAGTYLGIALLREGRVEAAERWFLQHLQRFPDDTYIRHELYWTWFNQYRTRDVEHLLVSRIQSEPPEQYRLLMDLLTAEFRRQLAREGLPYLREIDARVPGQPNIQLALGYALWQMGDLETAQRIFQTLEKSPPLSWNAGLILAEFTLERGDAERAHQILEGLLIHAPHPTIPEKRPHTIDRWYFLRSLVDEQQGKLTAALEAIELALEQRGAELEYLQQHTKLLQMLGRPGTAAAFARANQLETVQSELSEIVLRELHTQPTIALCEKIARLETTRLRTVSAAGWKRFAAALKQQPLSTLLPLEPLAPHASPGGGGAM